MSTINWAEVAAREYAVPAGAVPFEAINELLALLVDPDPGIRDTQACSTPAMWTRAGHAVLEHLACGELLKADNILSRSFAALILGETVRQEARLSARTD